MSSAQKSIEGSEDKVSPTLRPPLDGKKERGRLKINREGTQERKPKDNRERELNSHPQGPAL
jgi:hypothetical protein